MRVACLVVSIRRAAARRLRPRLRVRCAPPRLWRLGCVAAPRFGAFVRSVPSCSGSRRFATPAPRPAHPIGVSHASAFAAALVPLASVRLLRAAFPAQSAVAGTDMSPRLAGRGSRVGARSLRSRRTTRAPFGSMRLRCSCNPPLSITAV